MVIVNEAIMVFAFRYVIDNEVNYVGEMLNIVKMDLETFESSKKTGEIYEVESKVLIYAFKYSLGRMTYAPSIVIESIRQNINNLNVEEISDIINTINNCKRLGMDMDKRKWINLSEVLTKIKQEKTAD